MQGWSYQLLAGAALAINQDRAFVIARSRDLLSPARRLIARVAIT